MNKLNEHKDNLVQVSGLLDEHDMTVSQLQQKVKEQNTSLDENNVPIGQLQQKVKEQNSRADAATYGVVSKGSAILRASEINWFGKMVRNSGRLLTYGAWRRVLIMSN